MTDFHHYLTNNYQERLEKVRAFIGEKGLKVRKVTCEAGLNFGAEHFKNNGEWEIKLNLETARIGLIFFYLSLAIADILRQEDIWYKTANPILLNLANNEVIKDSFDNFEKLDEIENFSRNFFRACHLGFEVDYLYRNEIISDTEISGAIKNRRDLWEGIGFYLTARSSGNKRLISCVHDLILESGQFKFHKIIERIDDCII
ncbi:MAG: hypothetical protein AAFV80_15845, partial [Bacteroidota bacterium]